MSEEDTKILEDNRDNCSNAYFCKKEVQYTTYIYDNRNKHLFSLLSMHPNLSQRKPFVNSRENILAYRETSIDLLLITLSILNVRVT